jgi:hypothetical protein
MAGPTCAVRGLYSSLICEWRKQRDAGVLDGKQAGARVGRLSAEQAEIARLKRELAKTSKRSNTTEAALEIMGKAHAYVGDRRQVWGPSSLVSSWR